MGWFETHYKNRKGSADIKKLNVLRQLDESTVSFKESAANLNRAVRNLLLFKHQL
jgi:hypothetical protein